MDKVEEFIKRRFPIDCNWLSGNCFYFSQLLLIRFLEGEIFYDVIQGHFLFKLDDKFYDWTGKVSPQGYLVKWDEFEKYDELQKQVIIRDCVM